MNIIPWEFYLHYADKDLLVTNYAGMKEQVRYMQTWVDKDGIMLSEIKSDGNVSEWHNLGEWCPADGFPSKELVHTFYLWRCADFTAQAAIDWEKQDDSFKMSVEVPVGSHATVYLPVIRGKVVKEGGVAIDKVKEVQFDGIQEAHAIMQVSSGKYYFEAD